MSNTSLLQESAEAIARSPRLLIAAGAGMGVCSGMPDFRGAEGFWRAYPPYRRLGLAFEEMANPALFEKDPEMAWGFYGHRLGLYRQAQPHIGFSTLRAWATRKSLDSIIYTSNVDAHFQRAGFPEENIYEIHGSIEWLQCTDSGCSQPLWPVPDDPLEPVQVERESMRAVPPLPLCPTCQRIARPAILMFGDWNWNSDRAERQHQQFEQWLAVPQGDPFTIVELGAGTAIPSVRNLSERMVRQHQATLIRINPGDPEVPPGQIGLAMAASDALKQIDRLLSQD